MARARGRAARDPRCRLARALRVDGRRNSQTRERRPSSFSRSARASASRVRWDISRPSPSTFSICRSSRRTSKACSRAAGGSAQGFERRECLLEPGPGLHVRRPRGCLPAGLAEIGNGLLPRSARELVGQPRRCFASSWLSAPAGGRPAFFIRCPTDRSQVSSNPILIKSDGYILGDTGASWASWWYTLTADTTEVTPRKRLRRRCTPRTSNPVFGSRQVEGGFDSHTLPPALERE